MPYIGIMSEFILNNESSIRLSLFLFALILLVYIEARFPKKARVMPRSDRWPTNLLLTFLSSLFVRMLFPIAAFGAAQTATDNGWGLFNLIELPALVEMLFAIVILDLAIYWQHRLFHRIPIFWALHKVHHVDRDIDVTTGSRFHPLEIGLSMLIKMSLVLVIGAPVLAVIIFELILSLCALFHHANVKLPQAADRVIRRILVTPDMHRVHHSIVVPETDSNFGFSTSLWDKLFGTYVDQPKAGQDDMIIGLQEHQNSDPANVFWSLLLPFKSTETSNLTQQKGDAHELH